MTNDYYHTKEGPDDWTIHGRRHHLQVTRTEGSSGREDRRGNEIYITLYLVKDRSRAIDVSDQFDQEAHGFARLKDAIRYATDKLKEYDDRVDPRKKVMGNSSNSRLSEVLEAWDILITFTTQERTPARVKWLRSNFEIQGNTDDWLENESANVIDEYAKIKKMSFGEAKAELMVRTPRPWKDLNVGPETSPKQDDPFTFHLKPTGWTGAPCPICGCATPNLRARHRALKADEAHRWGVPYIKRVKVAFGTDFSDEPLKE